MHRCTVLSAASTARCRGRSLHFQFAPGSSARFPAIPRSSIRLSSTVHVAEAAGLGPRPKFLRRGAPPPTAGVAQTRRGLCKGVGHQHLGMVQQVVTIGYEELKDPATDLSSKLAAAYGPGGIGLLTISGVPGFVDLRQKLLPLASRLAVRAHAPRQVTWCGAGHPCRVICHTAWCPTQSGCRCRRRCRQPPGLGSRTLTAATPLAGELNFHIPTHHHFSVGL